METAAEYLLDKLTIGVTRDVAFVLGLAGFDTLSIYIFLNSTNIFIGM